MSGMRAKDTVGDRRRCRWGVMPHVGKWRLALEVRREHLRIHALDLWGSAILILIFLLLGATVEVGWPFVFVRPTVLEEVGVSCVLIVRSWRGTYIGVP